MIERKAMSVDKARMILRQVGHPRWSPSDDHDLLAMKAAGRNFTDIAEWLGRSSVAVQQRFHRLRAVCGVAEALEVSGLTSEPYRTGVAG